MNESKISDRVKYTRHMAWF